MTLTSLSVCYINTRVDIVAYLSSPIVLMLFAILETFKLILLSISLALDISFSLIE